MVITIAYTCNRCLYILYCILWIDISMELLLRAEYLIDYTSISVSLIYEYLCINYYYVFDRVVLAMSIE